MHVRKENRSTPPIYRGANGDRTLPAAFATALDGICIQHWALRPLPSSAPDLTSSLDVSHRPSQKSGNFNLT
ncbi:MAG: hypothetical protein SWY16_07050 [Cyanobacteriota bacterium]|nr:hypothetical protein [Cyanobacteriota bacterium]